MLPTLAAILLGTLMSQGQAGTSPRHAGQVVLLSLVPPEQALSPLASALRDQDPAIRTAAARVLAARNDLNPVPALVEVLAAERHELAAAEQVRALLMIRGQSVRAVVDPHARRIGGAAAVALLGWVARHASGEFPDTLATLAPVVSADNEDLVSTISYAARDPAHRDAVLRAWMPVAHVGRWKPVLDAVIVDAADLQRARHTIVAGLSSPRAEIRDDTVWFVVNALGRGRTLPDEIVRAALPDGEAPPAPDWERFGRELIARRLRDTKWPDRAEWLESIGGHNRRAGPAAAALLSRRERNALRLPDGRRDPAKAPGLPAGERPARTIVEWMPGLVAMTAAAAGCPLSDATASGYARVTYGSVGRVVHIAVDHERLPAECRPVLTSLARTGFADFAADVEPGDRQWHLLPLSKRFAECTSRTSAPSLRVGEEYEGQKITTPTKVKDVSPKYPAEMLAKGVQGRAVIEAVIADTGCVRELEVVRSSGAHQLDLAALVAVSGWEFQPTRVDGQAVPVRMTVTVNFSVSK